MSQKQGMQQQEQQQQKQQQRRPQQQRQRSDAHATASRSSNVGVFSTKSEGTGSAETRSAGTRSLGTRSVGTGSVRTGSVRTGSVKQSHSLIAPPSIMTTVEANSKVKSKATSQSASRSPSFDVFKNSSMNASMKASMNASRSSLVFTTKIKDSKCAMNHNNIAGVMFGSINQDENNQGVEAGNQDKSRKSVVDKYQASVERESKASDGNTNRNDVIDDNLPAPPGPKRHALDPNRAPGMPLDHKDSFCGRMMHYVTGGSNPTRVSGTFVPGIRMDGATEGEYPPGMFDQQGKMRPVKAFVNCFAGYFNTMGGSIPPCPGDCPPNGVNLNVNSNKANPLKKEAYEYPWSIRAGFLPEQIEAFELMEDSSSEMMKTAKRTISDGKSSLNTSFSSSSTSSPSLPEKLIGHVKEDDDANGRNNNNNSDDARASKQSQHFGPSQFKPIINNRQNFQQNQFHTGNDSKKASTSVAAVAAAAAADIATATAAAVKKVGKGPKECISKISSLTGSEVSLAPRVNGSLWRGLQLQNQLQKQKRQEEEEQRQQQEQMQRNTNQNFQEWKQPSTMRDPDMHPSLHNLPSIHQELRLRRIGSQSSRSSNTKVLDLESNEEEERLCQFVHQRKADWRPAPASGMI